jgi:hypothetical protein
MSDDKKKKRFDYYEDHIDDVYTITDSEWPIADVGDEQTAKAIIAVANAIVHPMSTKKGKKDEPKKRVRKTR